MFVRAELMVVEKRDCISVVFRFERVIDPVEYRWPVVVFGSSIEESFMPGLGQRIGERWYAYTVGPRFDKLPSLRVLNTQDRSNAHSPIASASLTDS